MSDKANDSEALAAIATPSSAPKKAFSRWGALAVLFVAQMAAIGSISYGFSVLLKPLATEFNLPRALVNQGLMVVLLGMAVFGPIIGRALDHYSGRLVVAAGAVLFGCGWLVIGSAPNVIVALLAAFLLLAPGGTALGPLTASTLVSRWFEERRGLALGISSVALSVGGLVVTPLLAFLIALGGWRDAVIMFGGCAVALILALIWFLPHARPPVATDRHSAQQSESVEPPAWRERDFWFIVLAIGAMFAVNGALLSCLVAYATDRGFSLAQGAALVSVISGVAIVGKLVVGWLSDKLDPRFLVVAVVALNGVLIATFTMTLAYPVLLAAAAGAGAAVGGAAPLWTVIVGKRFGLARMGRVMGLMSSAMLPINIGALHLVGAVYDETGSYVQAFQLFLIALAAAALLILPVRTFPRV